MTAKTFAIIYDDAPKSINHGGLGSRQHWSKGHREKRRWEGIFAMLLLHRKVPRGMRRVYVEAILEWPDNRRRDSENYRPALSKSLADALVKGGWLSDDTDEFFELGRVKIVSGAEAPRQGRTTICLEAEYDEEPSRPQRNGRVRTSGK